MRTRALAIVLIVVLACGSLVVWSRPSLAQPSATFTVTNTIDAVDSAPGDGLCDIGDDSCTLRAAIQEANALAGADTIIVPAGLYALTISGTFEDLAATGDLDIAGDLLIQGAGAVSTIVDGGQLDQVFQIIGTSVVTFSGLTIQNGNAAGWVDSSGNRHGPMGGAILNPAGSIT
ncbi:MAG TPA: hypothetical protein VFV93_06460, partial [Thermomicrobiales bacterium]|nr:hypothetical protein [Thermomicrobiales bacterium]